MGVELLFWWFLSTWVSGAHTSSHWYVSRLSGADEVNCGLEKSRPCKHIYRAITHADDGDVINIDGSGTSRDPYLWDFQSGLHTQFRVGVSIRSYKTRAFVSCRNRSLHFSCGIKNTSSSSVSLIGITFVNTSMNFADCSLKMSDVKFVNGSIEALSLKFSQRSVGNINISGCTFYNNSGSSLKIRGDLVNLDITDTFFCENQLRLHGTESALLIISPQSLSAQIRVNFNNISVLQNNCSGKACLEIRSGSNGHTIMLMKLGKFDNNHAGESVVDIRGSSVIKFTEIYFRQNSGRAINVRDGNSVQLTITKSTFIDNKMVNSMEDRDGGALCVTGFTREALVFMSRSRFHSNVGANGGACAFTNSSSLMLNIKRCDFIQNEGHSLGSASYSGGALAVGTSELGHVDNATISIHNSNFIGNKIYSAVMSIFSLGTGGALSFYVHDVRNLTLINNTFVENTAENSVSGAAYIAIIGTLHHDVLILNCEFIMNYGYIASVFTFGVLSSSPTAVRIQNSNFIQNKAHLYKDSYDIGVIHQGFLKMSFCTIKSNSGGGLLFGGTGDISLENSVISDNYNFMLSLEGTGNAIFTNVSMLRNNCSDKRHILNVLMPSRRKVLRFQASSFVDNFCKLGVVEIFAVTSQYFDLNTSILSSGTVVSMNNTVFRGNSGVVKSALTILNADVVHIENCSFNNNFGGNEGSHLTIQLSKSSLTISKTNFSQSESSNIFNTSEEQPYGGFLTVTGFGNISVAESSFISDSLTYDGIDLITVEDANKVFIDNSVTIQSPIGSKLMYHNFADDGIKAFSVFTQPCSISTYSIRRGSSTGLKLKNDVKCLPCPNGGNCTKALAARPNFWAYPIGDRVYLHLCPRGYCCSAVNQTCAYHNASYQQSGCQGNRTGILCGRCKDNFSEALFHTNCAPVDACTHRWYFVLFFICVSLFAFYLIQKPPVFQKMIKMFAWFIPRGSRKDYQDIEKLESEHKAITTPSFSSNGYLKILFYFYQVAGLLTVPSYGVKELLTDQIVFPITSLFNFQLYSHSEWNICPFAGLTPLAKALTQVVVVIAVFSTILFIYPVHIGLNKLRKRTPVLPSGGPYLGAILESMLLGYSAMTGTTVRLLHCVKIQYVSRWYYNAETTCYQWWQKASVAVIILYLFPFIGTLYVGSLRLHRRQTSAKTFLLACVFPLPYLLYVCADYLKRVLSQAFVFQRLTSKPSSIDLEESGKISPQCTLEASILEVLSAPFSRENQDDRSPGKIYWESILIGRRFILILIGSFVPETFLRSVCLAITCFIFLLHHLQAKPFAKRHANLAETGSLATLVAIAILNVGVESYNSVGTEYQNVQHQHIKYCLWAEAVLLGLIPFALIVFVLLALMSQLVRLAMAVIKLIRWLSTRSKSEKHDESETLVQLEI